MDFRVAVFNSISPRGLERVPPGRLDQVVALVFGRCIAEGTPSHVQNHPEVMRAYLGGA